ncbi:uncharacterized protein VP01_5433g1 [Puccinia sorghi]|uniref:Uncharacterized protein n=1 Tax=Puccinia sorghi TaxID=27349 RepID=A0A0L6UJM7_9BASI|nr:uncharacterized protein VP01_5433g1 [Puccinia sorghi]
MKELVAGNVYTYLNVNTTYANNTVFLIQAYNHFVLSKYQKDQKQNGKIDQEAEHEKIIKNRERVSLFHLLFSPKRHQCWEYLYSCATSKRNMRSSITSRSAIKISLPMSKTSKTFPTTSTMQTTFSLSWICIRMLPKKEKIILTFTNPPKDSQQKLIQNLKQVAFYAAESLQPKAMRHADEKLSDKSFTCKYWEIFNHMIIAKMRGIIATMRAKILKAKGTNWMNQALKTLRTNNLRRGRLGTYSDEEYTGVRSGDEEEDSDEEMEDKTMGTVTYGVDPPLLERMEEEENGWCGKDIGELSGYISEDQGVIRPNQHTRKGFGWMKHTKRCLKMRGKITQICVEDN